jgi:hypothetical protein
VILPNDVADGRQLSTKQLDSRLPHRDLLSVHIEHRASRLAISRGELRELSIGVWKIDDLAVRAAEARER